MAYETNRESRTRQKTYERLKDQMQNDVDLVSTRMADMANLISDSVDAGDTTDAQAMKAAYIANMSAQLGV